jgi:hypothetical protein
MATVAPKTFFANLFDESGTLAKVDNVLVFFADSGDITTIEPDMCNYLVVLGEVGVSNTQQIMDRLRGGAATITCSRQQEVA